MPPVIQRAAPELAPAAAELVYLTLGHMADHLFGGAAAARRALERLFRSPANRFSYQYAEVMVPAAGLAGLLIAYPEAVLRALDLPMAWHLARAAGLPGLLRFVWRARPLVGLPEAGSGEYFIGHMAVPPAWQGQGLGRALLAHAEQTARALGCPRLALTVDVDNARALALYRRAGFDLRGTVTVPALQRRFGYHGYHRLAKDLAST